MKYLPFENLTYRTKLSTKEAIDRLNENLESKKTFRWNRYGRNKNHKPYEGELHGNTFKITRIINYRNSFLPIIKGRIESDYQGIKIDVKMRLHPLVIAFISIWCFGVGIGCFAAINSLMNNDNFEPFTLIPFGMLLFAYGITIGGFKYESNKSKKQLAELFEAKIEHEKK